MGMKIIYHNPEKSLSKSSVPIVVDLDGTLADDRHRHSHAHAAKLAISEQAIQNHWREYHKLGIMDPVNLAVNSLVQSWLMFPQHEVWIVTARPDYVASDTCKWLLERLNKQPHMLAMREEGDMRKSSELKSSFLAECMNKGLCKGYHLIIDNAAPVIKALTKFGDTMLYSNHIPQDES
jgi:hypothetical protein